jgi:phenylacetate-CoA ligase
MILRPEESRPAPSSRSSSWTGRSTGAAPYLFEHSAFYQRKLPRRACTHRRTSAELDDIAELPFTEKDEIRATQAEAPPFGAHLAADPEAPAPGVQHQRYHRRALLPGPHGERSRHVRPNVARGYTAAGFSPGQKVVVGFNAGPFVAGAVYYGFDKIGCTVIPVGTGNTERMVTAIQKLGATGISCTPSYGLYLIDWCNQHGIDTQSLGLTNMITAGEPGGGDPLVRAASRRPSAAACASRWASATSPCRPGPRTKTARACTSCRGVSCTWS